MKEKKNSNLLEDLQELQETRNKIAHSTSFSMLNHDLKYYWSVMDKYFNVETPLIHEIRERLNISNKTKYNTDQLPKEVILSQAEPNQKTEIPINALVAQIKTLKINILLLQKKRYQK